MNGVRIALLLAALVLSAASANQQRRGPVGRPAPQQHVLAATGAGQILSRVTTDPVDEIWPAISPDGRTLLFSVQVKDPYGRFREMTLVGVDPNQPAPGGRTVYTSPATFADYAAWMPDGSSFFYSSNALGSWSLARSPSGAPQAAVQIVVRGEVAPFASRPTVSPDGKRVAFTTKVREVWNLAVTNVDGSSFTLLGEGLMPSWSPDGRTIAFFRTVNGRNQIFTVDPTTGTNLVQVTNGAEDNLNPYWSPDGRHLVFTSNRSYHARSAKGMWNLFIVRPDGTGLMQLTDGDGESATPTWGRDGFIYFASNQAGNFDIWRIRPVVDATLPSPPPALPSPAPAPTPAPSIQNLRPR